MWAPGAGCALFSIPVYLPAGLEARMEWDVRKDE